MSQPTTSVQLAWAGVAVALLVVVLVAVVLWAPRAPTVEAPSLLDPATFARDQELRKTKDFVAHVQCPLPVSGGIAEVEGEGDETGAYNIVAGFLDLRVFRPEGVVTIKVPRHKRAELRWHDAIDGQLVSCLPLPDWQELLPHQVTGTLRAGGQAPHRAHLSACSTYVPVDANGTFEFTGGTEACTLEPFVRRDTSSVVGETIPYDPEATGRIALEFVPRAVRLDHWQGSPADLLLRLAPDGLIVEHAQRPISAGVGMTPIEGLPVGARITAVAGEVCAGADSETQIALAEGLARATTTYSIVQP